VGRDAAEGMVELVQRRGRQVSKLHHGEALSALISALRP
jgi:prolyl-tRNA synthetase